MIVTQPKGLSAGAASAAATKIIPTKIVYGQQGKTQVRLESLSLLLGCTVFFLGGGHFLPYSK